MNQSDRSPNDDQLDDLLRQVEVPGDLKAKLHKLPNKEKVNGVRPSSMPPTGPRTKLWPSLILLAATLVGVSAFIAWPYLGGDQPADRTAGKTDPDSINDGVHNPELQLDLRVVDELQKQVEASLAKFEIARLERQLKNLRSAPANLLEQEQYTSMILAMADQTVLDLGGSNESVHANMVNVIDSFPNSKGAEIAQQFLDQQAN